MIRTEGRRQQRVADLSGKIIRQNKELERDAGSVETIPL